MSTPKHRLVPIVRARLERVGSIRYAEREITNPQEAVDLCRELIAAEIEDADREYLVAVFLNTRKRPVGFHIASIGTLDAALVHPREIFVNAILLKAHSVVIAHNHPSGNPSPSRDDIQMTHRLAEAGTLIGIEILDSLVIGYHTYTSLRSRGVLNN